MLKRKKEIIAKVMATTMLASTLTSTFTTNVSAAEPQTKATVSETTIAGDDRYKTAVEISKNYSSTSKHAVIVNGQKGIVDALTATPYASLKKAPILMTQSTKLNADTKKELTRRGVKTVDIVGGVNSVSDAVKAEIEAMGIKVNRIAGNSKYETSLEVAKRIDAISDVSKIAVANGEVLADAVSVAAPAAQNKMPIILAHPTNGLDAKTKAFIDGESISNSYVIGGTSSVSTTTQNSLPGTKKRLEGNDRQGTNASVIKEFYTSSSYDNMYVAKSGQVKKADEIADALAVGVLAASNQDPVMLVGKSLGSTQKTLLESKDLEKITKVGGNIPTASIDAIKNTQSSTKTVTTVAELKTALANAKDGDIINFNPSGTVSEAVSLSTTKNVTVNLNGTHSGAVSVDMANGTLNINGNVSNKVSVDAVKAINVSSGKTVKELVLNSGAKNATLTNKGTITTATVSATGVTVTNSGTITTLNPNGDTTINNTGTIGNMDSSDVVASISSPNAKQVVIRFNKSIDKNSIINPWSLSTTDDDRLVANRIKFIHQNQANSENTVTVSENCHASLSNDGKTLTITAPSFESSFKYFKGNYTIEIENITSNGIKQEKYVGTINVDDKIAPTVTEAKFNASTNKFEVSLSEPIEKPNQSELVLIINDSITHVTNLEFNSIGDKITFDKPDNIPYGKDAKIYISGLKDVCGNLMKPVEKSVAVTNTTLTTSITQLSNDSIKLTFNKQVKAKGAVSGLGEILQVVDSSTTNKVTIESITPINQVSGYAKEYKIKFNTIIYPTTTSSTTNNKRSFKFLIEKNNLVDITGVENAKDISITINLTKDTTAPTIVSTKLNTESSGLEITLSEDIKDSITASKITLLKGEGMSISDAITVRLKPGYKNVIEVKLTPEGDTVKTLAEGTYHVKFAAEAFEDLNGVKNKIMETSKITVKNTVSTDFEVLSIQNVNNQDNTFDITYSADADLDTEKVSYKNFRINNNNENNIIHSVSKVYVNNEKTEVNGIPAKTIRVVLPQTDSMNIEGNATLIVTGLKLKTNQVLADKSAVVQVKDNTAPTLTSAKVYTKSDKVVLTFDDYVSLTSSTLSEILSAITIKTGDDVVYNGTNDTAEFVVNGKEITIKLKVSDASNWINKIEKASKLKVLINQGQEKIKDENDNSAREKEVIATKYSS